MSVNIYKSHVLVIPEDDEDRQFANGFARHHAVHFGQIQDQDLEHAGGWMVALEVLKAEYVPRPKRNQNTHVVLLIDFDGESNRREYVEQEIPASVKTRVFVIGPMINPEAVRRDTGMTPEKIGHQLADECFRESYELWDSTHFAHNAEERARLAAVVKPFLFKSSS